MKNILVDDELHEKIKELAEKESRSIKHYTELALNEFLARYEHEKKES
jgi:predicted transcriptional regulator